MHLATGVASTLVVLAFLALRNYLRDAGEDRPSALGVPFIVIGSTLFAMLPGMEFAALAAAETQTDLAEIAAAQAALQEWFVPVLFIGALTFAIGVLAFVRAGRHQYFNLAYAFWEKRRQIVTPTVVDRPVSSERPHLP